MSLREVHITTGDPLLLASLSVLSADEQRALYGVGSSTALLGFAPSAGSVEHAVREHFGPLDVDPALARLQQLALVDEQGGGERGAPRGAMTRYALTPIGQRLSACLDSDLAWERRADARAAAMHGTSVASCVLRPRTAP